MFCVENKNKLQWFIRLIIQPRLEFKPISKSLGLQPVFKIPRKQREKKSNEPTENFSVDKVPNTGRTTTSHPQSHFGLYVVEDYLNPYTKTVFLPEI